MKTEASLLTQSLLVLGVFGITALTTYGAVTNGGMLNATPYQLRSATADANLSRLTDGKGGPALDTVIAKIKATAELKGGTPVNVTTYNAYIDNRLAAIDEMDNQVRSEFGSDYTFLFQYFYPRVAELKKTEDKTANLLSKISSVFGGDTTVSTAGTSTTGTASAGSTLACSNNGKTFTFTNNGMTCNGKMPTGNQGETKSVQATLGHGTAILMCGPSGWEIAHSNCTDGYRSGNAAGVSETNTNVGTANTSTSVGTQGTVGGTVNNANIVANTASTTGNTGATGYCKVDFSTWPKDSDGTPKYTGTTSNSIGRVDVSRDNCLELCNKYTSGKTKNDWWGECKWGTEVLNKNDRPEAPKCEATTIDGYTLYSAVWGGYATGKKSQKITGGELVYNQTFECQYGKGEWKQFGSSSTNNYTIVCSDGYVKQGNGCEAFTNTGMQKTYEEAKKATYECKTNYGNVYFKYAYGSEPGVDELFFYPVQPDCTNKYGTTKESKSECGIFGGSNDIRWSLFLGRGSSLGGNLPNSISARIANSYDCDNTRGLKVGITKTECKAAYTCTRIDTTSTTATATATTTSTTATTATTTAATTTSARRVLTADEKKVVKDYITAVIGGAGTEKEKAQKIYDAMIVQGLDAQHIADSISGTLADVNAYLAKRNMSADQVLSQLVESWYTTKAGRASDAEGKAYWIRELNSGKSQAEVEKAFDYAVRSVQIESLYTTLLGRASDAEGKAHYLNSNLTIDQIKQMFLDSPEYKARH